MGFTSTIREEGRQEGRQETQVNTLLRLLEKRFGPQPTTLQERLNRASTEELDAWILRVLDAESAEQVFETPPDDH